MGGPTVELIANAYLTRKEQLRDSGDISERTFQDALKGGKRFAAAFGKTRLVSDLGPDDFAEYRVKIAKTRGAVAIGNEVQQVRSILKFAYDEGYIAAPVRFGTAFNKPSAKSMRLERARHGSRDLTSDQIQTVFKEADVHLKAMILLSKNLYLQLKRDGILGNHRLLCGDSSKPGDVDRLLDGAEVHLVNTDPPYA